MESYMVGIKSVVLTNQVENHCVTYLTLFVSFFRPPQVHCKEKTYGYSIPNPCTSENFLMGNLMKDFQLPIKGKFEFDI